jgi:nitrite reductase/ring-hydroxylating ferredoxin subunit
MPRKRIARLTDVTEGRTVEFSFTSAGIRLQGFVVCYEGQLVAFENRCQHLPLPLDDGDGLFFTPDGRHLRCRNHGALFEPLSGRCIRGPCEGASLRRLSIDVSKGIVWLRPQAGLGCGGLQSPTS